MPLTTTMKGRIKRMSQDWGLYPVVRSWYRALNPRIAEKARRQARFYGSFLRPGDLCFDVGANVGQTAQALLAAGARVVAVEPNPACLGTLRWQFGRSPGFVLVPKAIAERPTTVRLYTNGTDSTASLQADWPALRSTSHVDVEATTLDELIRGHGRPTYCKIDVEGHELGVLRGLSEPVPYLSFEYHASAPERASDCIRRLMELGRFAANLIPLRLGEWDGGWALPSWLSPEECLARIDRGDLPSDGGIADIFARFE